MGERKLIPFFNIEGWMVRDLGLSKNEVFIYAAIFNFSCDGKSEYRGGRHYLAKSLDMPFSTMDRLLNNLVERDLIIKDQFIYRNMVCNNYKANLSKVAQFMHDEYNPTQNEYPTQNEKGCTQNEEGCTQNEEHITIYNNKDNNKKVKGKPFTPATPGSIKHPRNFPKEKLTDDLQSMANIEPIKQKKKSLHEKCIDAINNAEYGFSEEVKQRLIDFLPTTLQAKDYRVSGVNQWKYRLKSLVQLSKEPSKQIEIIEYSISHSITGFVNPNKYKSKSYNNTADNPMLKGQKLSREEAKQRLAEYAERNGVI